MAFSSITHMTHFSRLSLENCLGLAGWHIVERNEQPDYNGCRILARPLEANSSIRRNIQDLNLLWRYLSHWYNSLHEINEKLQDLPENPYFIVWGGGLHTEFLYHLTSFFRAKNNNRYAIVDSDPLKQGRTWRGIEIHAPSEIRGVDWSNVYLLISSYGSQESIARAALDQNVPQDKIIKLYDYVHVH
jgi:hypothetical protein